MADDSTTVDVGMARRTLRALRTKVKRKLAKLERAVSLGSPKELDLDILLGEKSQLDAWSIEYEDDSSSLQACEDDLTAQEADEEEYSQFE